MKTLAYLFLLTFISFSWAETKVSPDDLLKKAGKCEKNNPEQAFKYYSESLRYSDNSWKHREKCFMKRGTLLYNFKNFSAALADFSEAVQLNAENFEARKKAAECFFYLKEPAKALQQIEKAEALNDKDHEIYFLRGKIYLLVFQSTADNTENRLLNSSLEAFNRAIELKKKFPAAYYYRGRANMISNLLEDAVRDFNASIKYDKKMASAWIELSRTYIALEQNIKAIETLEECIQENKQFFPAYSLLFEGYMSRDFKEKLPGLLTLIEENLPMEHPTVKSLTNEIKKVLNPAEPEDTKPEKSEQPKEVSPPVDKVAEKTKPIPSSPEKNEAKTALKIPVKKTPPPKKKKTSQSKEPVFSDNWY